MQANSTIVSKKTLIARYFVYFFLSFVSFFAATGCEDNNPTAGEGKIIKKFIFEAVVNTGLDVDITATISDTTITAVVPAGTDITALIPTITIPENLTLTPESRQPQDFTEPVQYTVNASDKTTQLYFAEVVLAKYEQADIIAFSARTAGRSMKGVVDGEVIILASIFDDQVDEAIITEMELSPYAMADKQVGDVLVFQDGIAFITVTAEDGVTSKQYTLIPVDTAIQIQSFKFEKENNEGAYMSLHDSDTIIEGVIDYSTKKIHVTITPYIYALDRSSLVATFEVGAGSTVRVGATNNVSKTTSNDFTNEITYEVSTADASKSDQYTVIFTETSEAVIPDDDFRAYLKRKIPTAFNAADKMDVTHVAVKEYTSIDVGSKGISSLKGIEFFTSLKILYCQSNRLVSLNLEKNKNLEVLSCYGNQLALLAISQNIALTELWCYNNQLDSLDISGNSALITLSCYNNKLISLDVNARTTMKVLSCRDNQLTHFGAPYVKDVKQLIINAGEENQNEETRKNPLVTLNVGVAIKNHAEIKEAKTTLANKVTIAVYDDNGNLTCTNYDPNTESCN